MINNPKKDNLMKDVNHSEKSAVVIIGALFGDEGKGLLTDYHAARFGSDCIVARFNGGAQAGHTVVLPDGRRHVFSHFGSGTLSGAKTFLSRYFVSNPLLFLREAAEIETLGIPAPVVYADERAPVTTPFDMLINQWAEAARGLDKHGSCGVGFGETIERSLTEEFLIRIPDLADENGLRIKLNAIREKWTPARLQKLNIPKLNSEQKELFLSDKLRDAFLEAAKEFYLRLKLARPRILNTAKGIVLEGAQGLLLDEDYGWFPHVTRSHTGLKNAAELAAEAGIERLDCIYAARCYATRHGAGPLPHELPAKPYPRVEDLTNIPNPHQDSLRFGWLDLDLLTKTINADFERYGHLSNIETTKSLAVTCLDQIDSARTFFVEGGRLRETTADDFLAAAAATASVTELYTGSGPTRETVEKITFSSTMPVRKRIAKI